ncbi:TonB-dependent receptor [Shewanella electrodiphila]|uniref:TonB-dependent receptor n=1 Tax=Shewanella electrodiphila TaxID=934143 RepID=A0ABT0KRX2_9GAMM|nr:TonB-dependent receptor [Shewanella electrodiphila]MCL1046404.1 TonB-dependent receptor [Shewanella electrodiphila]
MNTPNIAFVRSPIAIVITSLLATLSFSAIADDAHNATISEAPDNVDKIQVWGTTITNNSALISEDIEKKQADHLSDLLRDQAGIDIGGSHSMVQGINIRGVDELDLNITVDGISQNNNMFHHSGNLLINADILKAVDINVGTNSVLTGGLSGGVAFETKDAQDLLDPEQDFGLRLHANYGSNDYAGASATSYAQLTDNIDAMVYFTYTDKNNFDDGDGNEIAGNNGTITNGIVKLGWDVDDSSRFVVSYDQYTDEGDYYIKTNFGSGYNGDNDLETQDIEYTRSSLSLAYELDLGDTINLRTSIYQNELSYMPSNTEGRSEHTGYSILAESKLEFANMSHTLRYGGEGYEQTSQYLEDGVSNNEETANSNDFYIEDEIGITEKLFVTPGVRYNHYKVDMYSPGTDDGLEKTWTDFTFGLSAKYLINDQWTISAGSTELFQGPGLRETYTDYDTIFDQDLKAETGVNNTVGLLFLDQDVLGLDQLGFSINVFKTEINDYIDNWSVGKGRPVGEYTNLGDYDIEGFESTLSLRKDAFNARVTYSKSNSENQDTGEALRYEVGDSASVTLGYELSEYDISFNWTSLVTLSNDVPYDGVIIEKAGYDVHNLTMQWLPADVEALTVNFGIENIFNEQYYSHASYTSDTVQDYESGRNFKLSASYIF